MITLTKALIGVGALGTTGLAAWGAYYISTPKTIQDVLIRGGLKILSLDKNNNEDAEIWKQKIESHKSESLGEDKKALKIEGLSFASESGKDTENINKFKDACINLLSASLEDHQNNDLKEKQAKEWCTKA